MNVTDTILVLILAFAGYQGYRRGFIVSLLSIVSFLAATILAFFLLGWGVQMFEEVVDGFNGFLPYIAFILIFLGVSIAINVVGRMLKKVIDLTLLGGFDSIAGGLVGIMKWVFGLSLIIWLSHQVGIEVPQSMQEGSLLYSKIESVAPFIVSSFSEYLPFLKSLFQSMADQSQPANP